MPTSLRESDGSLNPSPWNWDFTKNSLAKSRSGGRRVGLSGRWRDVGGQLCYAGHEIGHARDKPPGAG